MQQRRYRQLAMSADGAVVPDQRVARDTLHDLRSTRKRRRLGEIEWFEVAYRVYLFALVGLIVVVWVSDAVDGAIGDDVDTAALLARGPSVIGLLPVVAIALGVRSGADGGPISIETADVRHVLLAPISHRTVMLRPIAQRLRSAAFAVGLAGAVLGQLVATEVEGSRAAWATACGVFGAIVGVLFVASAVLAHALRMPRWLASIVALVLVVWQAAVAWGIWNDETDGLARVGPGNLAGRLALWGISQRPIDVVAIVVAVAAAGVALALGNRLRIEALARRGELVSQLRFAATVQDLRTVVQLRRQLRSEVLRAHPIGARTPARPAPRRSQRATPAPMPDASPSRRQHRRRATVIWALDDHALRRLPLARFVRIALAAALGGVGAALVHDQSPLFGVLLLGALFVVGLESLEPLSQEIDRPDLTDALPVDRGWIYAHHLVASAVLIALAALVGAAAATIVDPTLALGAFAVAIPVAWAGASGAVVVTVNDAPAAPTTTNLLGQPKDAEMGMVPPEFAGFGQAMRMAVPVILSAAGTVPVFVARFSGEATDVARSIVGVSIFIAAVVWWVRRRDSWGTKMRAFLEEGRAATT